MLQKDKKLNEIKKVVTFISMVITWFNGNVAFMREQIK